MKLKKSKNEQLHTTLTSSNDNLDSSVVQLEGLAIPLWGGHLSKNANEFVQKITSSVNSDKRLYSMAIESSKAQLRMHIKREIIPQEEGKQLIEALDKVRKEIVENKFTFNKSPKSVYKNIEIRISEIAPEASRWFNVARSNSNQVAGDLKVWARDAVDSIESSLQNLQAALIDKAEENVKVSFPGTAHSQLTQPISFGHFLMAFVEMFGRDRSRLRDMRKRMNESPYASGEIAGNSYHINREMVARIMGFDKACSNSIDAINSRDYAVEFAATATNAALNLSRLAEEMISWHSTQNSFISFSDAFVTQSPVIPYRRDPEALEMIRGKSSKIIGALMSIVSTLKGLKVEYANDYNEIVDSMFEAYDALLASINTMAALVADFTINRKQMKEAAVSSFSTALDLVDWIVKNAKTNLEDAATQTRALIDYAVAQGTKLSLLELPEIKKIVPSANDEIYSVLIASRAIISRRSGNGSNPVQIRKSIRAARRNFL